MLFWPSKNVSIETFWGRFECSGTEVDRIIELKTFWYNIIYSNGVGCSLSNIDSEIVSVQKTNSFQIIMIENDLKVVFFFFDEPIESL